ncbi:MAG: NTPase [Candidatus Bathyarchaeia archaeon]
MSIAVLVSGRPGVGKTTVFIQIVNTLMPNLVMGGFLTREVRKDCLRVGFEVEDIKTHEKGWLARCDASSGPRVGRYRVVLSDFEEIGVRAVERALTDNLVQLVAIDELGPMEFASPRFHRIFNEVTSSEKDLLCTVQLKMLDRIKSLIGGGKQVKAFIVDLENRETIGREIANLILRHKMLESP